MNEKTKNELMGFLTTYWDELKFDATREGGRLKTFATGRQAWVEELIFLLQYGAKPVHTYNVVYGLSVTREEVKTKETHGRKPEQVVVELVNTASTKKGFSGSNTWKVTTVEIMDEELWTNYLKTLEARSR